MTKEEARKLEVIHENILWICNSLSAMFWGCLVAVILSLVVRIYDEYWRY